MYYDMTHVCKTMLNDQISEYPIELNGNVGYDVKENAKIFQIIFVKVSVIDFINKKLLISSVYTADCVMVSKITISSQDVSAE